MSFFDDVKTALRETSLDLDGEIQDLIDAAKADLILTGVAPGKVNDDTDPLIKRAVVVYCKANFDTDSQESDRLQRSYDLLKIHLSMAEDYRAVVVTG